MLRLAARRLTDLGFQVQVDEAATARHQRFAGADEVRLAAIHRVAEAAPSVAMASRGGYGLSRLLDGMNWPLLARSVERGTRWVGYSDFTALHLGLLAHAKSPSWAGPTALDVNEHPYRVERNLLQLQQAGVLDAQKAVLLGAFSAWKPSPLDRGYKLSSAVAALRARTKVPILTGLPFGHVATQVSLPVGRRVTLAVQGRDAFFGW